MAATSPCCFGDTAAAGGDAVAGGSPVSRRPRPKAPADTSVADTRPPAQAATFGRVAVQPEERIGHGTRLRRSPSAPDKPGGRVEAALRLHVARSLDRGRKVVAMTSDTPDGFTLFLSRIAGAPL